MSSPPTAANAIKAAVTEQREMYAKSSIPRALVQSIPFLGQAIDIFLTEGGRRAAEDRLTLLLAAVEHDLERVRESAVDLKYLESPAFADLLEHVMRASVKARDKEKILFNARVLSGAIQVGARDVEDPHLFLDLLNSLDDADTRIVRVFILTQHETPRRADLSLFDWAVEQTTKTILVQHLPGMRSDDLQFRMTRLTALGYLKEIPPDGPNLPAFRAWELHNVVHRLASWLDQYGGFPSAADLE